MIKIHIVEQGKIIFSFSLPIFSLFSEILKLKKISSYFQTSQNEPYGHLIIKIFILILLKNDRFILEYIFPLRTPINISSLDIHSP